ncbi:MAG TPA: TonB-dependent receptor [Candidatus Binataceae bacterium]|nr:TonB-dependent receptor [Candidatus Binataceae bacterium]
MVRSRRGVSRLFLLAFLQFFLTGVWITWAEPPSSQPSSKASGGATPMATATASAQQAGAGAKQKKNSQQAKKTSRTKPVRLPELVVTATRIPQPVSQVGTTVTIINDQQIQDQKIQQTSDALREVPGVQVVQSGGPGTTTSVFIRGSSSSEVLTLLDGVEVNTGGVGYFDFANLTTDNTNRIEVIRGAGGALYGSSAIGGVINQITQEGSGPPRFSLLSDGGNWETQRQVATASGSLGSLGYSGSVSYYSTNGFQSVNSQYDNLSLTSRLDYHITETTTLRVFARYTGADVGLPEFSNTDPGAPLDPTAHQRTEFMLFKAEIESHLTDKLTLRVNGSFVRDEIRLNKVPSPGLPNSESDDIPDEIRATNAEAIYAWQPGQVSLVGFDFKDRWTRDGDNSTYPGSPPSITVFHAGRQEYAGYVQQQLSLLHDHLLVTGGFRADGNSQFGEEVSPAWSVAIPFPDYGVILRGSYSEGFQAPTFDELYFPGFGNPNLKATTSSEYDGSIEKRFGELATFTATYFSRRTHDLITDVPCSTCEFGIEPANVGRADVQGVELVPAIYPFRGFSLSGSFTVLDSTHRPLIPGLQPVLIPKRSATGLAEYKRSNLIQDGDELVSALSYQFVGDREDLQTQMPFGEENHGSYQLFNLTVSYKMASSLIPHLMDKEAFVRIQNLFDRRYSQNFGFPAAPLNFEAGFRIGFQFQDNFLPAWSGRRINVAP